LKSKQGKDGGPEFIMMTYLEINCGLYVPKPPVGAEQGIFRGLKLFARGLSGILRGLKLLAGGLSVIPRGLKLLARGLSGIPRGLKLFARGLSVIPRGLKFVPRGLALFDPARTGIFRVLKVCAPSLSAGGAQRGRLSECG
jgi:hypothetical protein